MSNKPAPAPGVDGGVERGARRRRPRLLARLRNYFVTGILVTAPIGVTVWLISLFVGFVDRAIVPLIPAEYNPDTYLPFSVPGLGVIIMLVGLTLIGALFTGFIGRWVMRLGERIVARMPVVRSIYGAVKQIFETVLAQSSTAFRQVVLVEYPRRGTWAVGFITGTSQGEVQRRTQREVFNVFVPTTPNPTSGFLILVPREEVIPLDMTVEDGIKLVISGGIVTPPDQPPRRIARIPGLGPEPARESEPAPGGDSAPGVSRSGHT